MSQIPQIFNRNKVRLHRDRACHKISGHDFLLEENAGRIGERLKDINREFAAVLNIGCGTSYLSQYLKTELLVNQDLSEIMAGKAGATAIVADEEKLPYAPESFDLVISNLAMHTVNDLPGALAQIKYSLKKDGILLASIYGISTLRELQQVMIEVESEEYGGASPRVSPFTDVQTLGSLMQRVGFISPITDSELIRVSYDNVIDLMHDLRHMGEANALIKGSRPLTRDILAKADMRYKELFPDGDGGIMAGFDVITITGFK